MSSPDSHDSFASDPDDQWDPYDEPRDDPCDDPRDDQYDDPSQRQTQSNELKLCQLPDWDSERTYDESYIRYSIEWKVTLNKKAVMGPDTVQDTVLAPAASWQHFLHPKLDDFWDDFWRRKNRPVRSEDTNVVVSVTQRKEPDLTRRFADTSIDWAVIENQLVAWGEFYRAGKKLRLKLSFNYVDTSQSSTTRLRRTGKRGSTTRQMLAEGAAQLDAEQASSGHPSVWRKVYNTMRCPGLPCKKGLYCWVDPIGKKHYPLNTRHLKSLIMYMQEEGHTLETHDDVPAEIRKELYAEEQKSLERHQKVSGTSALSLPPINITNVLPAPSGQTSDQASSAETPAPDMPSKSTSIVRLDIPGFLDEQVEEYCTWQQSRVKKKNLKDEYKKACDVMIEDGMDLDLIRDDPNPKFLIDKGVKRGPALHVVGDIDYWVEKVKRARTEE